MDNEEDQEYSCLEEFFVDSCRHGDFDDVVGCFEDGVDVAWFNDNLNNCLHMAGANGHIDIIRHVFKYIESNSRFNKEKMLNQQNCDGNTPLHWAAVNGQREVVQLFLENGANANIKNSFNRTPLDESLHLDRPDIAEQLVKFTKADLDDYKEVAQMNTQVYDISKEDLQDIDQNE